MSKARPLIIATLLLPTLLLSTYGWATETEDEDNPPADPVPVAAIDQSAQLADSNASQTALHLLSSTVAPGSFNTLYWTPEQSFASIATPVPVLVAHGAHPGPVVCMTAAVHGDELNGIEMVRRLMFDLEPKHLNGSVIGIPIVNLDGFRRAERYLSDRRDLNRHFPGNPQGSSAARIAHSLFTDVIAHCQYLVDLHTGSMARTNLPQLRGNLRKPEIVEMAKHLGGITVLHGAGAHGTLRRAATDAGIPALTMEAGGPLVLEEGAVDYGVKALQTLLDSLGMKESSRFWSAPQPVFYQSKWVRASQGGILLSNIKLGDKVKAGQVLGTVIDPISNTGSAIFSPYNGRILGMAVNQVVQTGYAAYHVGIEKAAEKVAREAEAAESEGESQDIDGPSTSPSLDE